MASVIREIKFQEILKDLLNRSKATVTQKKLAAAIGVSSTTISHYITGRISPSFSALAGIAEFFNVTLDYLVFGERTWQPDNSASTVRIDVLRALAESNSLSARHRDLILRVNQQLYARVEEVARDIVGESEHRDQAGFFTFAEVMALEACAQRTRIMMRTVPSDLEFGQDGEAYAGIFFDTLVSNIQAGRSYQYLLYGPRSTFAHAVQSYRDLLTRAQVPPEALYDLLEFRVLDSELPAGVIINDLDVVMLARQEPILWERFRDDGIHDGTFAYVSIRHQDALGGTILRGTYVDSAQRMFKRDWDLGTPV